MHFRVWIGKVLEMRDESRMVDPSGRPDSRMEKPFFTTDGNENSSFETGLIDLHSSIFDAHDYGMLVCRSRRVFLGDSLMRTRMDDQLENLKF